MEVLVVGAGPTGLTAALELARLGIKPDVVEKRQGPSALSRAVGIMPASVRKLMPSGVGEKILAEGIAFKKIHLHRNERMLLRIDLGDRMSPDRTIVGLPQDRTEALMRDGLAAQGIHVRYNAGIAGVKSEGSRVRVIHASGAARHYDWVIGADGARSTVRESLGIPYPGYDLPQPWSIADLDLGRGYDHETFSLFLLSGGNATVIAPMERRRVRVVSSTPNAVSSLPIDLDIRRVRRSGTFTISVRQAETCLAGRVLLAGDAAHCHSPVGGRGMNLGIDDACAAARAIAEGSAHLYSPSRHKKGASVISFTERLRKAIQLANPAAAGMIDLLLASVDAMPFLHQRLLARFTSL